MTISTDKTIEEIKKLPEDFHFLIDRLKEDDEKFRRVAQLTAKMIINDLKGELTKQNMEFNDLEATLFSPYHFADIVRMVDDEIISRNVAKKVLSETLKNGYWPSIYVEDNDLAQISDVKILKLIVDEIIDKNTKLVESYRAGKTKVLGSLIGQVMGRTKGKANPRLVNALVELRLKDKI